MESLLLDLTQNALRWIHVVAGVIWIGHLYFFNWVNAPFGRLIDATTKRAVVPELMPRALYWFRFGALWTFATGILLLVLLYYYGGLLWGPDLWGISMRAIWLHTGAIIGTYMAYNVWMKIWPAQRKIVESIKAGQTPDAALLALSAARSKQSTYLSVPLLLLMVSVHQPLLCSTGIPGLGAVVVIGFGAVKLLYRNSERVSGT